MRDVVLDTVVACLSGLLGHVVGETNASLKSFNYGLENQTGKPTNTADGRLKGY